MLHVLLDFLSPPHCALCNTPLEESSILCECCLEDLPDTLWNPCTPLMDSLASVRCLDDYSNTAGRLVRLSKYAKRGDIARLLGLHMGTVCGGITQQCDAIVPVPQHWKSTLSRGFPCRNLIAAEISRAQTSPCNTHCSARAEEDWPFQPLKPNRDRKIAIIATKNSINTGFFWSTTSSQRVPPPKHAPPF